MRILWKQARKLLFTNIICSPGIVSGSGACVFRYVGEQLPDKEK